MDTCEYLHVGNVEQKPLATVVDGMRAAPAREAVDLEWVLDTGTENDLCPARTVGWRIKSGTMIALETASGIVHPRHWQSRSTWAP